MDQIREEENSKRSLTRSTSRFSVTSSSASSPARPEAPVHERLSKSKQKQQLFNVMSQLKDELEMTHCTFQPTIPYFPNGSSSHDTTPVYERLNAEAEQMKIIAEKREKLKKLEEMKQFTFQPRVETYESGKSRNRDTTPIHERLNAEADQLKKQQEKRVELKIKTEEAELTFKPSIKPMKSAEKKRYCDTVAVSLIRSSVGYDPCL
jgi:hypothetical protein